MDAKNAIELKDVSLTYSIDIEDKEKNRLLRKGKTKIQNRVLDHLNLEIRKGEILGIVGTNGAGKSTLLSVIARIIEPDSGAIEIDGKVATILELGMGFHQDLTGRENIILKGELYGFSKKQMEEKTEAIIDYSGIRKFIDNPVRTYSSGMSSRLAFSIMIHVDADILLVDEILSTGDATFSAKATDFFKKILKDGKTVVFVSHAPGAIESICTRAIWIDKGKIIADGRPKKICALYKETSLESLDVVMDQAKSGMADAQYQLALFYRDGINVEHNDDAYREWLELAAEQGHIKAQVEFADHLMDNPSPEKTEQALLYYQSSASRGDATARARLSKILGEDSRLEYFEVKKIFNAMAERGNPADMFRFANFLLKTAWNEKDRVEAYSWFKRVAENYHHPDAIIQLATMYRDGIGVKKNKNNYIETLKLGASLKIPKAINMLADVYATGAIIEEDQTLALSLYEECAELGVANCQYTTATMYLEGKGTEPNTEKANYWFKKYSQSLLVPYQITATNILKKNAISNVADIQTIYSSLESSKDPKALIELSARIHERPDLYPTTGEILLENISKQLSYSYGKGMSLAYSYYSSPDSKGYDPSIAEEIAYHSIYLGDSEQMFKWASKTIPKMDDKLEIATDCMKVAARMGNINAISYCAKHQIDYT